MPRADGENVSKARAAMEASGHLRGDRKAQVCTAECGKVVDGLSMVVWEWKRSLPITAQKAAKLYGEFLATGMSPLRSLRRVDLPEATGPADQQRLAAWRKHERSDLPL